MCSWLGWQSGCEGEWYRVPLCPPSALNLTRVSDIWVTDHEVQNSWITLFYRPKMPPEGQVKMQHSAWFFKGQEPPLYLRLTGEPNFCIYLGNNSTSGWGLAKGGWNQHENAPSPMSSWLKKANWDGRFLDWVLLNWNYLFSFTSAAVSSSGSCPTKCDFKHLSAKSELQI